MLLAEKAGGQPRGGGQPTRASRELRGEEPSWILFFSCVLHLRLHSRGSGDALEEASLRPSPSECDIPKRVGRNPFTLEHLPRASLYLDRARRPPARRHPCAQGPSVLTRPQHTCPACFTFQSRGFGTDTSSVFLSPVHGGRGWGPGVVGPRGADKWWDTTGGSIVARPPSCRRRSGTFLMQTYAELGAHGCA